MPSQPDNIPIDLSSIITCGNRVKSMEIAHTARDNCAKQSVKFNEQVSSGDDSIDATSEVNIFGDKRINDSPRWVVLDSYSPSKSEESCGDLFHNELRNTHLLLNGDSLTPSENDLNLSGDSNPEAAEKMATPTVHKSAAVLVDHVAVIRCSEDRIAERHPAQFGPERTSTNSELPMDIDDSYQLKHRQLTKKERMKHVGEEDQPSDKILGESHIPVPQNVPRLSSLKSQNLLESHNDLPTALPHELQVTQQHNLQSICTHELLTPSEELRTSDCDLDRPFCQDASSSCDTSSDSSILPTFFDISEPADTYSSTKANETVPEFEELGADISKDIQDQGVITNQVISNSKLCDSFLKAKYKCVQVNSHAGSNIQLSDLAPSSETMVVSCSISPVCSTDNQSATQSPGKNVGFNQSALLGNSTLPLVGVVENSLRESENGDKTKEQLPSPSKLVIRSESMDTVRKLVGKPVKDHPTTNLQLPVDTSEKESSGSEIASGKTGSVQQSSSAVVSSSLPGSNDKSGQPTKAKVSFDNFRLSAYQRVHKLMLSKVAKVAPEPRSRKKTGNGTQIQEKTVISEKVQIKIEVSEQCEQTSAFDEKAQQRTEIEMGDNVQKMVNVVDKVKERYQVVQKAQNVGVVSEQSRRKISLGEETQKWTEVDEKTTLHGDIGVVQVKTEVCDEFLEEIEIGEDIQEKTAIDDKLPKKSEICEEVQKNPQAGENMQEESEVGGNMQKKIDDVDISQENMNTFASKLAESPQNNAHSESAEVVNGPEVLFEETLEVVDEALENANVENGENIDTEDSEFAFVTPQKRPHDSASEEISPSSIPCIFCVGARYGSAWLLQNHIEDEHPDKDKELIGEFIHEAFKLGRKSRKKVKHDGKTTSGNSPLSRGGGNATNRSVDASSNVAKQSPKGKSSKLADEQGHKKSVQADSASDGLKEMSSSEVNLADCAVVLNRIDLPSPSSESNQSTIIYYDTPEETLLSLGEDTPSPVTCIFCRGHSYRNPWMLDYHIVEEHSDVPKVRVFGFTSVAFARLCKKGRKPVKYVEDDTSMTSENDDEEEAEESDDWISDGGQTLESEGDVSSEDSKEQTVESDDNQSLRNFLVPDAGVMVLPDRAYEQTSDIDEQTTDSDEQTTETDEQTTEADEQMEEADISESNDAELLGNFRRDSSKKACRNKSHRKGSECQRKELSAAREHFEEASNKSETRHVARDSRKCSGAVRKPCSHRPDSGRFQSKRRTREVNMDASLPLIPLKMRKSTGDKSGCSGSVVQKRNMTGGVDLAAKAVETPPVRCKKRARRTNSNPLIASRNQNASSTLRRVRSASFSGNTSESRFVMSKDDESSDDSGTSGPTPSPTSRIPDRLSLPGKLTVPYKLRGRSKSFEEETASSENNRTCNVSGRPTSSQQARVFSRFASMREKRSNPSKRRRRTRSCEQKALTSQQIERLKHHLVVRQTSIKEAQPVVHGEDADLVTSAKKADLASPGGSEEEGFLVLSEEAELVAPIETSELAAPVEEADLLAPTEEGDSIADEETKLSEEEAFLLVRVVEAVGTVDEAVGLAALKEMEGSVQDAEPMSPVEESDLKAPSDGAVRVAFCKDAEPVAPSKEHEEDVAGTQAEKEASEKTKEKLSSSDTSDKAVDKSDESKSSNGVQHKATVQPHIKDDPGFLEQLLKSSTSPGKPSTSPRKPSTSPRKPSTSPRKPSTSPRKPSTSPRKPSTSPRKPSTSPRKPSTSPRKPSTSPKKPSTSPRKFSTSLRKTLQKRRRSAETFYSSCHERLLAMCSIETVAELIERDIANKRKSGEVTEIHVRKNNSEAIETLPRVQETSALDKMISSATTLPTALQDTRIVVLKETSPVKEVSSVQSKLNLSRLIASADCSVAVVPKENADMDTRNVLPKMVSSGQMTPTSTRKVPAAAGDSVNRTASVDISDIQEQDASLFSNRANSWNESEIRGSGRSSSADYVPVGIRRENSDLSTCSANSGKENEIPGESLENFSKTTAKDALDTMTSSTVRDKNCKESFTRIVFDRQNDDDRSCQANEIADFIRKVPPGVQNRRTSNASDGSDNARISSVANGIADFIRKTPSGVRDRRTSDTSDSSDNARTSSVADGIADFIRKTPSGVRDRRMSNTSDGSDNAHTSSVANGIADFIRKTPPGVQNRRTSNTSDGSDIASSSSVADGIADFIRKTPPGVQNRRTSNTSDGSDIAHTSSVANGIADFIRKTPPGVRDRRTSNTSDSSDNARTSSVANGIADFIRKTSSGVRDRRTSNASDGSDNARTSSVADGFADFIRRTPSGVRDRRTSNASDGSDNAHISSVANGIADFIRKTPSGVRDRRMSSASDGGGDGMKSSSGNSVIPIKGLPNGKADSVSKVGLVEPRANTCSNNGIPTESAVPRKLDGEAKTVGKAGLEQSGGTVLGSISNGSKDTIQVKSNGLQDTVSKTGLVSPKACSKTGAVLPKAGSKTGTVLPKAGSKTSTVLPKAGSKTGTVLPKAGSKTGTSSPKAGSKAGTSSPKAGSKAGTVLPKAGSKTGAVLPKSGSKAGAVLPKAGSKAGAVLLKAGSKADAKAGAVSPNTGSNAATSSKSPMPKSEGLKSAERTSGTSKTQKESLTKMVFSELKDDASFCQAIEFAGFLRKKPSGVGNKRFSGTSNASDGTVTSGNLSRSSQSTAQVNLDRKGTSVGTGRANATDKIELESPGTGSNKLAISKSTSQKTTPSKSNRSPNCVSKVGLVSSDVGINASLSSPKSDALAQSAGPKNTSSKTVLVTSKAGRAKHISGKSPASRKSESREDAGSRIGLVLSNAGNTENISSNRWISGNQDAENKSRNRMISGNQDAENISSDRRISGNQDAENISSNRRISGNQDAENKSSNRMISRNQDARIVVSRATDPVIGVSPLESKLDEFRKDSDAPLFENGENIDRVRFSSLGERSGSEDDQLRSFPHRTGDSNSCKASNAKEQRVQTSPGKSNADSDSKGGSSCSVKKVDAQLVVVLRRLSPKVIEKLQVRMKSRSVERRQEKEDGDGPEMKGCSPHRNGAQNDDRNRKLSVSSLQDGDKDCRKENASSASGGQVSDKSPKKSCSTECGQMSSKGKNPVKCNAGNESDQSSKSLLDMRSGDVISSEHIGKSGHGSSRKSLTEKSDVSLKDVRPTGVGSSPKSSKSSYEKYSAAKPGGSSNKKSSVAKPGLSSDEMSSAAKPVRSSNEKSSTAQTSLPSDEKSSATSTNRCLDKMSVAAKHSGSSNEKSAAEMSLSSDEKSATAKFNRSQNEKYSGTKPARGSSNGKASIVGPSRSLKDQSLVLKTKIMKTALQPPALKESGGFMEALESEVALSVRKKKFTKTRRIDGDSIVVASDQRGSGTRQTCKRPSAGSYSRLTKCSQSDVKGSESSGSRVSTGREDRFRHVTPRSEERTDSMMKRDSKVHPAIAKNKDEKVSKATVLSGASDFFEEDRTLDCREIMQLPVVGNEENISDESSSSDESLPVGLKSFGGRLDDAGKVSDGRDKQPLPAVGGRLDDAEKVSEGREERPLPAVGERLDDAEKVFDGREEQPLLAVGKDEGEASCCENEMIPGSRVEKEPSSDNRNTLDAREEASGNSVSVGRNDISAESLAQIRNGGRINSASNSSNGEEECDIQELIQIIGIIKRRSGSHESSNSGTDGDDEESVLSGAEGVGQNLNRPVSLKDSLRSTEKWVESTPIENDDIPDYNAGVYSGSSFEVPDEEGIIWSSVSDQEDVDSDTPEKNSDVPDYENGIYSGSSYEDLSVEESIWSISSTSKSTSDQEVSENDCGEVEKVTAGMSDSASELIASVTQNERGSPDVSNFSEQRGSHSNSRRRLSSSGEDSTFEGKETVVPTCSYNEQLGSHDNSSRRLSSSGKDSVFEGKETIVITRDAKTRSRTSEANSESGSEGHTSQTQESFGPTQKKTVAISNDDKERDDGSQTSSEDETGSEYEAGSHLGRGIPSYVQCDENAILSGSSYEVDGSVFSLRFSDVSSIEGDSDGEGKTKEAESDWNEDTDNETASDRDRSSNESAMNKDIDENDFDKTHEDESDKVCESDNNADADSNADSDAIMGSNIESEAVDSNAESEAVDSNAESEAVESNVESEAVDSNAESEAVDSNAESEALESNVESEAVNRSAESEAVESNAESEAVEDQNTETESHKDVDSDSSSSASEKGVTRSSPKETGYSTVTPVKIAQNEIVPSFQCPDCPKIFKRQHDLNVHRIGHSDVFNFQCEICFARFRHKKHYDSHKTTHEEGTKECRFQCTICPRKYPSRSRLNAHFKRHTNEWLHECCLCLKRYKVAEDLMRHMKIHRPPTIECDICQKRFYYRRTAMLHRATHSPESNSVKCDVCDKICALRSLDNHMLLHEEKKYQCEICNRKFLLFIGYKTHMERHIKKLEKDRKSESDNDEGTDSEVKSDKDNDNDSSSSESEMESSQNENVCTNLTPVKMVVNEFGASLKKIEKLQFDEQDEKKDDGEDAQSESHGKDFDSHGKDGDSHGKDCDSHRKDCDSHGKDCDSHRNNCDSHRKHGDSHRKGCDSHQKDSDSHRNDCDTTCLSNIKVEKGTNSSQSGVLENRNEGSRETKWDWPTKSSQRKDHDLVKHESGRASHAGDCQKVEGWCGGGDELEKGRHDPQVKVETLNSSQGNQLSSHVNKNGINARFQCPDCPKVFKRQYELKVHRIGHSNVLNFQCEICFSRFKHKKHYDAHRTTHEENFKELRFQCTICSRKFASNSQLKTHIERHKTDRPHECGLCKKTYKVEVDLKKHMTTHGPPTIECDVCHKRFHDRRNAIIHRRTHSPASNSVQCRVCNKICKSDSSLKSHMLLHEEEKHHCKICDKKFRHIGSFNIHMERHKGKPRYECEVCQKRFYESCVLQNHLLVHENKRLFQCKECSKRFNTRNGLRHHCEYHAAPKYTCETCGMKFSQRVALKQHVAVKHSDAKTFTCEKCPKQFVGLKNYHAHLRMEHGSGETFACEACDKVYVTKSSLASHLREVHRTENFKCKICSKEFSSRSGLNGHKATQHSSGKERFECEMCPKVFKTKGHLDTHRRSHIDPNDRLLKCEKCDKRFHILSDVRRHMETHKRRPFDCKNCGALYRTEEALRKHMLTHNKGKHKCGRCNQVLLTKERLDKHMLFSSCAKTYICPHCNKEFARGQSLKIHIRSHTKVEQNPCKHCGQQFNQKGDLVKHLFRAHNESEGPVCTLCRKSFKNVHNYELHMKKIHPDGRRRFRCDQCEESFCLQIQLDRHLTKHTGKSLFECEICHKGFNHKRVLMLHIRCHTGEHPYSCPVCQRPYKDKCKMMTHVRVVHSEDRPHECKICSNRFKTNAALKSHEKVHSDERNYACELCDATFKGYSTLKSHMLIHTGEKKYECEICGKRFAHSTSRTAHMRVHDGLRPYPCENCGSAFTQRSHLRTHIKNRSCFKD
ncbi:uncharacterized protein LOC135493538 [Lineus longissimus]|uniref:uncharacterized protein LOC135493538 n=1 Tax=Lineus longissimus TaxID=88925 RepID=UPI00315D4A13